MKPIKVIMSAFGSYAGEETVSFEEFNHGIFLITGDTGAGKTTIFDAITYALYDQTSGGRRDGDMMRSQYAQGDTPTFVELTFLYEGKTYRIRRNPKYFRAAKRRGRDGEASYTEEKPAVELILPDGRPYIGKIKETNQKIVDIIGLDVNQFTQIAMIAQGDFLKLLHAPSKERKEIFAKIFDTRIYGFIQQELRDRAKALGIELAKNKDQCIYEMRNVRLIPNSQYIDKWSEDMSFIEVNPDRILSSLTELLQETKQREEEIKTAISTNSKALELVRERISQAETVNALFDKQDKAAEELKLLIEQRDSYEKLRQDIQLARKALKVWQKEDLLKKKEQELQDTLHRIHKLQEDITTVGVESGKCLQVKEEKEKKLQEIRLTCNPGITRIQDAMEKYEELSVKQGQMAIAKKRTETANQELEATITKLNTIQTAIAAMTAEQEILKGSVEQLLVLTQSVKDLELRYTALQSMEQAKDRLKGFRIALLQKTREVESALLNYNSKSTRYDELNQDFITEQVGIIAERLTEGDPCPVCGSTSHPRKAALSIKAVTQKDVDESKAARNKAEQELQTAKDKQIAAKGTCEKELDYLIHEGKRIIDNDFTGDEEGLLRISIELAQCSTTLVEQQSLKHTTQLNQEKYSSNQVKLESNAKDALVASERKEVAVKQLQEATTAYQIAVAECGSLQKNLPYETKQTAVEQLQLLQKQVADAEDQAKKATEQHARIVNQKGTMEGALKTEETAGIRQESERETAVHHLKAELTEQGFADLAAYQICKKDEATIETMENRFTEYREKLIKVKENQKTLQEQTEGKTRVELSGIKEEAGSISQLLEASTEENKVIYSIRMTNEKAEESLTKLFQKRSIVKSEYELIGRLDKTANGNLSGTVKLDFQTYIQRRYFEHIIHEANKRLVIMSSNQFILQCRSLQDLGTQGEVGLDLDVYSMVTDKSRDVKTLSGGESFMASLSMALGMADVIQNTAGKIHLDTMFIDEGFGSLDDDTREQAILILNDLAEGKRLVGIISHVTELKERIGQKLVVRKDEKGSSVSWETGT